MVFAPMVTLASLSGIVIPSMRSMGVGLSLRVMEIVAPRTESFDTLTEIGSFPRKSKDENYFISTA